MTVALPSQSALNGYIVSLGAAGGVAYCITLVAPTRKKLAIAALIVTLIVTMGAVAYLDHAYNSAPP